MNLIAYDYVKAAHAQTIIETNATEVLASLGSDVAYLNLAGPISHAYYKLVKSLITPELWDWCEWWMYECDFGTEYRIFKINHKTYITNEITLEEFLSIID
jgi:hypothetical protein